MRREKQLRLGGAACWRPERETGLFLSVQTRVAVGSYTAFQSDFTLVFTFPVLCGHYSLCVCVFFYIHPHSGVLLQTGS